MSIEFSCQNCNKLLRVGSENAGKKARCPQCGTVVVVPQPILDQDDIQEIPIHSEPISTEPILSSEPIPQPRAAEPRYFVDTDFGETYGPVNKSQLDGWVAEGRITGNYVIRQEGAGEGRYASDYYPSLAASASAGIPQAAPYVNTGQPAYQAPAKSNKSFAATASTIRPAQIDLSDTASYAWKVFSENMGLLLGTTIAVFAVSFGGGIMQGIAEEMADDALAMLLVLASLLVSLFSSFLSVGQVKIALKLSRGQRAEFMELFSGGLEFLNLVAFCFLLMVPFGIIAVAFVLLGFALGPLLSVLLLIIVSIALYSLLWPAFFLLIDGKANPITCFKPSFEMALPNVPNTIALYLSTIGITIVGILALCIGYLFAYPYIIMLWSVAYLMMSGQIRSR